MKYLTIILLSGTMMSCTVFGDSDSLKENEVPSVVQKAFSQQFPKAANVEWEKSKEHFEAEFEKDGKEVSALINKEGTILMTEEEISAESLPEKVSNAIASSFNKTSEIEDVEKIKKEGVIYYQIELKEDKKDEKNIVLNTEGQVIENIILDN